MPTSTVCAVLKRIGLNRLWRLEPPEPPNRYCRRHPGELIHVDVKKLGRFERPGLPAHLRRGGYAANLNAGWEFETLETKGCSVSPGTGGSSRSTTAGTFNRSSISRSRHLEIDDHGRGELTFFLFSASIDGQFDGPRFDFSWEGCWEVEKMCGRGRAVLGPQDQHTVELWIHFGDQLRLQAVRG